MNDSVLSCRGLLSLMEKTEPCCTADSLDCSKFFLFEETKTVYLIKIVYLGGHKSFLIIRNTNLECHYS